MLASTDLCGTWSFRSLRMLPLAAGVVVGRRHFNKAKSLYINDASSCARSKRCDAVA